MSNGFLFPRRNPLFKLHIHRWTEKHRLTVGLAIAAHQLAVVAEPLHIIAHALRERRADPLFPQRPPAVDWLRLYRSHRALWVGVGNQIPTMFGGGVESLQAADAERMARRFVLREPKLVEAWGESVDRGRWVKFLRIMFRTSRREYLQHLRQIKGFIDDVEEGLTIEQMITASSEVHFFLAVTLPCVVEFEMLPIALLRQARAGDELAIERVLRLDDMAIEDPFIKRWRDRGTGEERRRKVDLVSKWTREGMIGQLSVQGVKQSMAGLIALYASRVRKGWDFGGLRKVKLDSTGIRKLFDAVARDRGKGKGAIGEDDDLIDLEPESWRQAVSKRKHAWLNSLPSSVRKTWTE